MHGVEGTAVIPGGSPSGGDATGAFKGTGGTLTCLDCHSAHGQNTVTPYLHWRMRAGEPSGPFVSSNLLRQRPGGATTAVTDYGSDWCLACHKGRGTGGLAHNHPVDSLATTSTPFTYANVIVGGGDVPTPLALSADQTQVYVADTGRRRIVQFNVGSGTLTRQWPALDPVGRLSGLVLADNRGGDAGRDLVSIDILEAHGAESMQLWQQDGTSLGTRNNGYRGYGMGANADGSRIAMLFWGGYVGLWLPSAARYQDDWPQDVGGNRIGTAYGVAIDAANVLYIADYENSRIAVVPNATLSEGWTISQYIGAGQLRNPLAIAMGPGGLLYVADTGNDRILVLQADGTVVRSMGSAGSGPGQLAGPSGIAVAADGTAYVADSGNARIMVYNPDGSYARTLGDGAGLWLELATPATLSGDQTDPPTYNATHLMADPRLSAQEGHGPICQQCHDDARDPGTLVDGIPVPSSDLRVRGWFPHESPNPSFLIETQDGLCLNCHSTDVLP
jgi:DNA-binding beta-propeller fold protein YncE